MHRLDPRRIWQKFRGIEEHASTSLADLAAIRGNRLEALKRDRAGQHSIRVNDRWRVCFSWRGGDAHDVEIVDYH